MKCSECNAEIADNAKFCPVCGAKVEKEEPVKICPNCGEVTLSHTVCPSCGWYNGRQVKTVKAKKEEAE